ncbi:hypothetical protein [Piscinibacter sp. HJYY11]|uniref:hypothetical protein n=1 Tax=Piscinibacter sp. HJYY11 TaxID=2801333 RepID=UPI00191DD2B5|nr:hypothetical protein [Piscinibacter sp. HJYY11]MBL0726376.1 hypothetical protein [Piscinibacter sp. HJYY11]
MSIDVKTVFAILGPLFLVLALIRMAQARAFVPQAKAWLITGAIFSVVAAWLWWQQAA